MAKIGTERGFESGVGAEKGQNWSRDSRISVGKGKRRMAYDGSRAQIGPLTCPAVQYKEVSPSFDIVKTAMKSQRRSRQLRARENGV